MQGQHHDSLFCHHHCQCHTKSFWAQHSPPQQLIVVLLLELLLLLLPWLHPATTTNSASSSSLDDSFAAVDLHIVLITQNGVGIERTRAENIRHKILKEQNNQEENDGIGGRRRGTGRRNGAAASIEVTLLHKIVGGGFAAAVANGLAPALTNNSLTTGTAGIEGYWAVWPAIRRLSKAHGLAKWTLFCSAHVSIPNANALANFLLRTYNHAMLHFVGKAFVDKSPVIIHHFHMGGAFHANKGAATEQEQRFHYADTFVGFVFSGNVLQQILEHFEKVAKHSAAEMLVPSNFVIDPGFEISKLIFDLTGTALVDDGKLFCIPGGNGQIDGSDGSGGRKGNSTAANDCFVQFHAPEYHCKSSRKTQRKDKGQKNNNNIFYAVKTHSANHWTRIPVVKQTWAPNVGPDIGYFSDKEEEAIPTIDLGIPNTRHGHCAKTFAILRHFLERWKNRNGDKNEKEQYQWLMLADDDTLLSVPRLRNFIRCWLSPPGEEKKEANKSSLSAIIAGQRYGYGFNVDGTDGYDYPTGGAGILFSAKAVEMLARNCTCPSLDSPDDMIVGICARRLGIPIIHSPAFHQARPDDYPEQHLQAWAGKHISFHKFEDLDPQMVFLDLLSDAADANDDGTVDKVNEEDLMNGQQTMEKDVKKQTHVEF